MQKYYELFAYNEKETLQISQHIEYRLYDFEMV